MKSTASIFIVCLSLLFSSYAFSSCGGGGTCGSCGGDDNGYSDSALSACNCADLSCSAYNDCLSLSRCCEAFGNIGSLEH